MSAVSRSPAGRPVARPGRGGAGAEAPLSRPRVRRTRLWMVLLLLTPVVLAAISLLAFDTGGPPEPSVKPLVTPAGWYGVTDADFGYSVPDAYQQNTTWTDQNGDFFYGTAPAFVAETLLVTKTAPTAASRPPASFESFGQNEVAPYALHGGHAITVPGTQFGYEELLTRPGGYRAVVVDTWEAATSTQMWLLLRTPASVAATVIASLQG